MRDLKAKTALVTGAASGIGRAIAIELARAGADLFLIDVNTEGLTETAARVTEAGSHAVTQRCDLTQTAEITAVAQAVRDHWGRLDLLINNAGVAYYGATERMTAEQWDWLLKINLLAPIELTRQLLPLLLRQPEAHLLNVCSIAGLVAGGKLAAYHTSKFGLVGFSEALRAEYRGRGLGVTALCPGLVRTRLLESAATDRPNRRGKRLPTWLCTSPETVARRALRAIRRDRGLVLVSPMARVLWFLKRLSPRFLAFLTGFSRKSLGWKKSRSSQHQVAEAGRGPGPTDFPSAPVRFSR